MDILIAALAGIAIGILIGVPWGTAISLTDPEEVEELKRNDFD